MSFHKPLPLKLSQKARQDFVDILRYTGEKWGRQQLLAYRAKVDDATPGDPPQPRAWPRAQLLAVASQIRGAL